MRDAYKGVVSFCSVFSALILFVVGCYLLGGVVCLCLGMVLADVPERIDRRVNGGMAYGGQGV